MAQFHVLIGDVQVGFQRSYTRVVTDADLADTSRLTGDYGGYHTDEAFARAAGFRERIVPGMFQAGLITRLGGELNLLAREMRFRFDGPVYVGDTLTCSFTITAVRPERNRIDVQCTVVNQHGETVLTAEGFGYLPVAEWGIPSKPKVD